MHGHSSICPSKSWRFTPDGFLNSSQVHCISASGLQFGDNNWVCISTVMFLPLCARMFCSCWSTSINFKSGFILDLGPSQDAKVIVL